MPAARQRSRSPTMAWAVVAMIGTCFAPEMNTSGRYRMPPHNSSANASPTGRYQVGAPAHAWEAADDLSRSRNATKKITPNSNCLYREAFRGSREVPPGHDGVAGLFELGIIRAPSILPLGA